MAADLREQALYRIEGHQPPQRPVSYDSDHIGILRNRISGIEKYIIYETNSQCKKHHIFSIKD